MLFHSIFRSVNVTLLCITNSFHSGGWGEGKLGPLFLNFLHPPMLWRNVGSRTKTSRLKSTSCLGNISLLLNLDKGRHLADLLLFTTEDFKKILI